MFQQAWDGKLVLPMPGANGKYVLGSVDKAALDALIASAPIGAEDRRALLEQGAAAAAAVRADRKKVAEFLAAAREFEQNGWTVTDRMFKSDVFNMLRGGVDVDLQPGDRRTCQILSENLMLTPDMADALREQLELKQGLQQVIRAHEVFSERASAASSRSACSTTCTGRSRRRSIS